MGTKPWLLVQGSVLETQAHWLDVDGMRMQTGDTRTMIFPVRFLLSYISRFMIIEPGDVVTTGAWGWA